MLLHHRRQRTCAGHSVVQFARDAETDRQVAFKFFLSRAVFDAERDVRAAPPLAAVVPPPVEIYGNEDGAVCDGRGHALPPFVALERGHPLDEWRRRRTPEIWECMRVRPAALGPHAAACAASHCACLGLRSKPGSHGLSVWTHMWGRSQAGLKIAGGVVPHSTPAGVAGRISWNSCKRTRQPRRAHVFENVPLRVLQEQ